MEAIEISGLEKNYKSFKLDIEELVVKKGFITGFIGPNGSGKTTTIKCIMDMNKADAGDILVLGEGNNKDIKVKEKMAFVGEYSGFLEESILKRIKRSVSRFYENWDDELYNKIINKFNNYKSKWKKKIIQYFTLLILQVI